MSKRKSTQNPLRRHRIAKGLSLLDVGRHFRGGVTRERIRQIESLLQVRSETVEAYLAAVSEAVRERERLKAICKRVAAEVDAEVSG